MTEKLRIRATEQVSPEARERMIAAAAYSLAEQRGFQNGSAEDDWLRAERQVDEFLAETRRARSGLDLPLEDSVARPPSV